MPEVFGLAGRKILRWQKQQSYMSQDESLPASAADLTCDTLTVVVRAVHFRFEAD